MPQPPRDPAHLWYMLDAARSVVRFVGERTLDEYLGDPVLEAAVEWKIERMVQAAERVSDEFKESHPGIPWRRLIGQKDILIRDEGDIDQRIIWGLVKANIPELIAMLEPLIPPIPGEPQGG